MRAVCAGTFAAPFELPKPDGAWPRSVALPCASQVRGLLAPRDGGALLLIEALGVRAEFGIAEGGRFCESSRCRGAIAELFGVFPFRPPISGM